jgi:hypothetical protein
MPNSLLTSKMIANEALMQFKNALGFTRGANRQYDKKFAVSGAKVGNSIDIRKPQRFTVTDGATVSKQSINHEVVPLTLDQRKHVAFGFSSEELTLSIDKFSETYITPAAVALANKVDMTGLALAQSVFGSVGTPGTTMSSIDNALDAGALLDEMACPMGNRNIILDSRNQAGVIKGSKELFNSGKELDKQYEKGIMSTAAGFDWRMAQNIHRHTVGPQGGTPLVNGASQTGSTLVTDGWTAGAASRLNKGDVFTIDGVYAVNPLTYQSTGQLQQFTVTEAFSSDGSGAGSVSISPAIITSGATQNVNAAPADNAPITVLGAAGIVTPLNMAYHKDAFILGSADLEMPKGVDMSARAHDAESGLSIRFVRYWDGDKDEFVSRLDILFGWLLAHKEWAVRLHG